MTRNDIAAGMRLKELAGWNQTEADWQGFLAADSEGSFVAEVDGTVRGTAATITFERRFAWVGMVLVDPEYRGRGIGTTLLERAIAYLDGKRVPCIKLDATPAGKPIYEKLGFESEWEIERWMLRRAGTPERPEPEEEMMPPALVERVLKADREVFGADRSALLRSVHQSAPRFTDGLWNAGGMEGYAFGRQGSFADHLGPWVAKDEATARHLLDAFLGRSRRDTVVVDCVMGSAFARSLLEEKGFQYSRGLTRMYRGGNPFPGRPELLCAILGPEFG